MRKLEPEEHSEIRLALIEIVVVAVVAARTTVAAQ
jgi:hypothetical protein